MVRKGETGPVSQCFLSFVIMGVPAIIFLPVLCIDIRRLLENPVVAAPPLCNFRMKILSCVLLLFTCLMDLGLWVSLYKNEDYVVLNETSMEVLHAIVWSCCSASLWIGYNRACSQSKALRAFVASQFVSSLFILYCRPRGIMEFYADHKKPPLYFIACVDVVRFALNLLLSILMLCWPRDVPRYVEISGRLLSDGETDSSRYLRAPTLSEDDYESDDLTSPSLSPRFHVKSALSRGSLNRSKWQVATSND